MFARSFGLMPVTVLMRISIPNPSGYCGAIRLIRHRGNANTPNSITDATASSVLDSFVTVISSQNGSPRPAPHLTWHGADQAECQRPPLAFASSPPPVIWARALGLMFATSGVADPAGETRM